jgi:hypothetical protein
MPAATLNEITFEEVQRFLLSIGFDQPARVNGSLAYYHRTSDTLATLAIPQDGRSVRPSDWLSIRIRLENKGLVQDSVIAQLKLGKLPAAS